MRFCLLLIAIVTVHYSFGQCDKVSLPDRPVIRFACRNINVYHVSLNGSEKNFLKVEPGSKLQVSFKYYVQKGCDFCPECRVQLYWGINGWSSSCFSDFNGYEDQKEGLVSGEIDIPEEAGLFYITLGGSLESSCNISVNRPACEPDKAIAAIMVGKPAFTAKATILEAALTRSSLMLIVKNTGKACAGRLRNYQWFLNDSMLVNETDSILAADREGKYKVEITNCAGEKVTGEYKVKFLDENTAQRVRLENVYFEQGSYALISSTIDEINKLVGKLNNKPKMVILLEGHTDSHGGEQANLELSLKRVEQIRDYLVSRGIKKKRIEVIGYGDSRPVADNCCDETRKLNRRVEMVVLKE